MSFSFGILMKGIETLFPLPLACGVEISRPESTTDVQLNQYFVWKMRPILKSYAVRMKGLLKLLPFVACMSRESARPHNSPGQKTISCSPGNDQWRNQNAHQFWWTCAFCSVMFKLLKHWRFCSEIVAGSTASHCWLVNFPIHWCSNKTCQKKGCKRAKKEWS